VTLRSPERVDVSTTQVVRVMVRAEDVVGGGGGGVVVVTGGGLDEVCRARRTAADDKWETEVAAAEEPAGT
jgi:hypothetical protein